MKFQAGRDTYGERIFNGDCPYTGKHCMDWACRSCEVGQAESHLFEDEDSEGALLNLNKEEKENGN